MELAAQDPQQGTIFYTLDQSIAGYRQRMMKVPVLPLFRRVRMTAWDAMSPTLRLVSPGCWCAVRFHGPVVSQSASLGDYLDRSSQSVGRALGWLARDG